MSISSFPNPNVDIFNNEYWLSNTTSSSGGGGSNDYVHYPIAQGTVSFPLNVNVNNNLVVSNEAKLNKIIFNDLTEQTTAFKDLSPNPANTYSNPSEIIVNSKGQITSITSGGGGGGGNISIVSNGSSVNSWVINTTTLTKKYYQFYLYATNGFASNTVSNYTDNTSITTPTNVGLVMTGLLAKVDTVFQTANRITYCAGYQQNYNWSKDTYGYLASNINNFTTSVNIVSKINGVNENESTCPPTAGTWNGCQLEITIKDGYVNLPTTSTLTLVCFSLD